MQTCICCTKIPALLGTGQKGLLVHMQLNPIADPDDCRTYKAYNYGAAIGIVVAVVVGIALLIVGFMFFYRRSRSRQVSSCATGFFLVQADSVQPCTAALHCDYLLAQRAKIAVRICAHLLERHRRVLSTPTCSILPVSPDTHTA